MASNYCDHSFSEHYHQATMSDVPCLMPRFMREELLCHPFIRYPSHPRPASEGWMKGCWTQGVQDSSGSGQDWGRRAYTCQQRCQPSSSRRKCVMIGARPIIVFFFPQRVLFGESVQTVSNDPCLPPALPKRNWGTVGSDGPSGH